LQRKIKGENTVSMHPWYHGFSGEIKQSGTKYTSHGMIAKTSDTNVLITELSLCRWTEDYRLKVLNKLKENGTIRNISKNNCTNERVYLEIESNPEKVKDAEEKGFEKVFQLTSPLATSNIMCFDSNNKLVKYNSPEDLLNQIRLNFYVYRRVRSYKKKFFLAYICIYFYHD